MKCSKNIIYSFIIMLLLIGIIFVLSSVISEKQKVDGSHCKLEDRQIINVENLSSLLKKHYEWGTSNREKGQRLNLRQKNLWKVDLSNAYLRDKGSGLESGK